MKQVLQVSSLPPAWPPVPPRARSTLTKGRLRLPGLRAEAGSKGRGREKEPTQLLPTPGIIRPESQVSATTKEIEKAQRITPSPMSRCCLDPKLY